MMDGGLVAHDNSMVPMELDEMDGISMQSYRHSDIDMMPVVGMIAAANQQRYSAVGARWDVSNLQRALRQLRVTGTDNRSGR